MKLVMTVVYGFLITIQGSLSQNIITYFYHTYSHLIQK